MSSPILFSTEFSPFVRQLPPFLFPGHALGENALFKLCTQKRAEICCDLFCCENLSCNQTLECSMYKWCSCLPVFFRGCRGRSFFYMGVEPGKLNALSLEFRRTLCRWYFLLTWKKIEGMLKVQTIYLSSTKFGTQGWYLLGLGQKQHPANCAIFLNLIVHHSLQT